MSDEVVAGALSALAAATAVLLQTPPTGLSDDTILTTLRDVELVQRQFAAIGHRLIAQADERNLAGQLTHPSTTALLTGLLRLSPRQATARVRAARLLGPRRALTGQLLAPEFEDVAAAQADGAICPTHATVITDAIRSLPAAVRAEHGVAAERALTQQAYRFDPAMLSDIARRLVDTLDPDGSLHDAKDRARRRDVALHTGRDGMGRLTGLLTPEATAALKAVLDSLTQPSHPAATEGGNARPALNVEPAQPLADNLTPGQRRHDALLEMCLRMLADGGLPPTGGVPTTLLITINWTDLQWASTSSGAAAPGRASPGRSAGPGRTAHGDPIPATDVARLATNADLVPVVLADTGGIIAFGRTRRLASHGQRRALAARDRGCTLPGCNRPPSWTQTHHIRPWTDGGPTDLTNLALVCNYHHTHALDQGHTCTMINGVPHWTQPHWQDPSQTPHRNYHHHPELLVTQGP